MFLYPNSFIGCLQEKCAIGTRNLLIKKSDNAASTHQAPVPRRSGIRSAISCRNFIRCSEDQVTFCLAWTVSLSVRIWWGSCTASCHYRIP